MECLSSVMPGLVPGIHVLNMQAKSKDVDGRDNPRRSGGSPGHDDVMGQSPTPLV